MQTHPIHRNTRAQTPTPRLCVVRGAQSAASGALCRGQRSLICGQWAPCGDLRAPMWSVSPMWALESPNTRLQEHHGGSESPNLRGSESPNLPSVGPPWALESSNTRLQKPDGNQRAQISVSGTKCGGSGKAHCDEEESNLQLVSAGSAASRPM